MPQKKISFKRKVRKFAFSFTFKLRQVLPSIVKLIKTIILYILTLCIVLGAWYLFCLGPYYLLTFLFERYSDVSFSALSECYSWLNPFCVITSFFYGTTLLLCLVFLRYSTNEGIKGILALFLLISFICSFTTFILLQVFY